MGWSYGSQSLVTVATNVSKGNFVYIQNFNSLVVYIIFNAYAYITYVVFSLLANSIVTWLFSGPLPML